MRILFDQGTPVPLRHELEDYVVETSYERGWATLDNGELIAAAEQEGFEVFITTDQNLKHQQNISERSIAIVTLSTPSWPRIQNSVGSILQALKEIPDAGYAEVEIP